MDARVKEVIRLIKKDLSRKITLEEMARLVNLSPTHLRYMFKADAGQTPSQYQKSLRLREAARLLESTFLNHKEIMIRIGVGDESHFVRDFKRAYQMTPTQYRARHHKVKR